jgi:hypothetical protein
MKNSKRIWVSGPFFSSYESFSDFLALCKVLSEKSSSVEVENSVRFEENFSTIQLFNQVFNYWSI